MYLRISARVTNNVHSGVLAQTFPVESFGCFADILASVILYVLLYDCLGEVDFI